MSTHEPKICEAVAGTAIHLNEASISFEFKCPECHRAERFHIPFKGPFRVICDGDKIKPLKKHLAA